MTDLEKLEYIHCTLQDIMRVVQCDNDLVDEVDKALSYVEDLRGRP